MGSGNETAASPPTPFSLLAKYFVLGPSFSPQNYMYAPVIINYYTCMYMYIHMVSILPSLDGVFDVLCLQPILCSLFITILCVAYFNDIVVGGVCCRIETEGEQRRLYIMTLGVLAPYRRLGIGKKWIECSQSSTCIYTCM